MREVREVIGLESVLVLSATETAADAEILDGLQVQRGAGNLCCFRTNAGDDLIHAELAFAERLELAEHASGAAAAAATGKGCDGVHRGVLHDDVGELAHFLGHGGEGKILIALNHPAEPAGVLLREKALGSLDKEIDVEANGAEGEQQNEKLMVENPA